MLDDIVKQMNNLVDVTMEKILLVDHPEDVLTEEFPYALSSFEKDLPRSISKNPHLRRCLAYHYIESEVEGDFVREYLRVVSESRFRIESMQERYDFFLKFGTSTSAHYTEMIRKGSYGEGLVSGYMLAPVMKLGALLYYPFHKRRLSRLQENANHRIELLKKMIPSSDSYR